MPSRLTWNAAPLMRALKAELRRRIAASCHVVADRARQLLSTEGAGQAIRRTTYRYGGRRRTARKGGLVYGHSVSSPGEPPRKQTGRLLGSVAQEVGERLGTPVGRVGTNVKYGKALEMGAKATRSTAWGRAVKAYTWILLARPWLRRALAESRPAIRSIMGKAWRI